MFNEHMRVNHITFVSEVARIWRLNYVKYKKDNQFYVINKNERYNYFFHEKIISFVPNINIDKQ